MPASSTVPDVSVGDEEPLNVYVLFLDIVNSTRQASDRQQAINSRFTALVSSTREFREVRDSGDLISLPTGDGMALVFLKRLQSPLRCAIEIAQALRADPFCQVRMGIHGGPVFVTTDINGNKNVSGAGINLAERVMSCGAGGHILLSSTVADSLRHLTRWREKLSDLGEFRAKKDRVHIWNFVDGEIGSTKRLPAVSQKMIDMRNRFSGALIALVFLDLYWVWERKFDAALAFMVGAVLILAARWLWTWWRISPNKAHRPR